MVEIAVSDTGKGLPEGVREHLFRPFFTTKESGMGVGLSISRSIIEAHGGQIARRAERLGRRNLPVHAALGCGGRALRTSLT